MSTDQKLSPAPDVENVHYVDGVGTNFLFRGAQPLLGSGSYTFNCAGLKSALGKAAAAAGVTLPGDYRFIVVNLMQWANEDEIPKILAERQFFLDHPHLGDFFFWDTSGTELCALSEPLCNEVVRTYLAMNLDGWLGDQLVARTETLREMLLLPQVPTVVYAHCNAGDDRTGEMMGAYYLRWMNKSWKEVNVLNRKYAGLPFGCSNYRATQWYGLYLLCTYQYALDMSEAFECKNGTRPEVACK